MIAQSDLAAILVEHHGVAPGDTEADLLAGLILDEYQRDPSGRSLRDCVEAAKSGYPGFFRAAAPAPVAPVVAKPADIDPRDAMWPVTMRVLREARGNV